MKILKTLYTSLILMAISIVFVFTSCDSVELRGYLENDDLSPGPITDVTYQGLPGAAEISYTLPDDEDVLYVVAEYEIRPGVRYEVKSSYYSNSLTVVGFGTTDDYNVDLYVVDRSGNRSEKATIAIKPLAPPVQTAFATLDYVPGFGGIYLTFENAAKADLVANVLVKDEFGDWVEYDKYYTALPSGAYSVRGLEAMPKTFGVSIYDRWSNRSDTLIKELTPVSEMQLNKSKFAEVKLPGDGANAWTLPGLWNDVTSSGHGISSTGPFPTRFNFSLGTPCKLSRFKFWGVYDGREYSNGNIREMELWGSNDGELDPQGSFDGWELLGLYTVVKPSGLPEGELSSDDRALAAAGFEFDISQDAPPVKYIRINILSSFASPRNVSNGTAWMREITFWGEERP